MANEGSTEPNVIYGIDFKNKRKAAPAQPTPEMEAAYDAAFGPSAPLGGALSLDSPLELLYETTLGYAPWPEQHYVAPESDPA